MATGLRRKMQSWLAIALAAVVGSASGGVSAQMLNQPLLTIEGAAGAAAQQKIVTFTREQIAKLPQRTITTSTPWTEGRVEFKGVALRDLVSHASMEGNRLKVVALNNYASEMRLSDVLQHALVAHEMNGKPMSVRDKGPLWIVFPFDEHPELKSEQFYARSVWQVSKFIVQSE